MNDSGGFVRNVRNSAYSALRLDDLDEAQIKALDAFRVTTLGAAAKVYAVIEEPVADRILLGFFNTLVNDPPPHAEGDQGFLRNAKKILCPPPDLEDLSETQLAALHSFRATMLEAAAKVYAVIDEARADGLLTDFFREVVNGPAPAQGAGGSGKQP